MDNSELHFIKSATWKEVFSLWEKGEAELPRWIEHYTKRGFASWGDWRSSAIKDLCPDQLHWSLYEITDPQRVVQKFYAGPFRAWINKYYDGHHTLPFGVLAKNAEIQKDQNIQEIINAFPENSTLIGLKTRGEIVIIEGMHRCLALAVASEEELNITPKLFIACAEFIGDLPLLGQENSPT